jgi:hypothetical protein
MVLLLSFIFVLMLFVVFVVVPLFVPVPSTDYYNASSASITFRWLLLIPSGGLDLVLTPFASETTLSSPLRGPGHLFDPFPTLCFYCSTVLVCFGFVVGEPTPFSFFGSTTSSSSWIRSGESLVTLSLIQLEKKKKK